MSRQVKNHMVFFGLAQGQGAGGLGLEGAPGSQTRSTIIVPELSDSASVPSYLGVGEFW